MKIINKVTKLETRIEREEFFDSLWSSPEFKKLSQDPNSVVGVLRDSYCSQVRYFYHMQNKDLERSAFTSWYNILSIKTYENLYIQDLYFLHEITHQCTMTYSSELDFYKWCEKMRENEVYASLISEVMIYLEMPSIRPKTFQMRIWVDKFMSEDWFYLYKLDKDKTMEEILKQRVSAYEIPSDKVEEELSKFRQFSYHFYNTWQNDYLTVERAMLRLKAGDDKFFDKFIMENQSEDGILFKHLVEQHYNNYLNHNFIRPHY